MRNLVSRWCFLALLFVPLATSAAWAQTFTGGVRGVVNDSGGVVPGVTVTLINEANGASRDAVSNESGEYNFSAVPPGAYTVKAELTGFKTFENKGVRVGTQQFVTLDITLEVGQLQETITVTGDAPLIDTSNASTGARDRLAAARDAAERRPLRVPVRRHGADGRGLRRRAVQPPAGSDQRLAAVAGRRRAPRQQLPGGRRADHRPAQPRLGQPDHRGARRRQRAGAPVRRRDRPHRRRHVQRRRPSRAATAGTAAASTRRGRSGAQRTISSPSSPGVPLPDTYFHLGGGGFGGPIIKNRTFFWSSAEGYGSNTTRNGAQPLADRAREGRRLLAELQRRRASWSSIYDPLTGDRQRQRPHAVPRQRHPGQPPQPGRGQDAELPAEPDARRQQRQQQLRQHRRDQRPRRSCIPARSTTASPTRCR